MKTQSANIQYDADSEVLYVGFRVGLPTFTVSTDEVIWRFDDRGLLGITLLFPPDKMKTVFAEKDG